MATAIAMPRQGQSVESCIITKWFRKKGDAVTKGELLFSYETDKAAFDFESPADGTLLAILFDEGSEVPVLANVAVIGTEGEDISAFATVPGKASSVTEPEKEKAGSQKPAAAHVPVTPVSAGFVRISPRARMMAESSGIDTSALRGSGPNGRIVAADIEKAVKNPAAATSAGSAFTDKPLSNVRRIISKAMHASLSESAQLTHHMSADARKILAARKSVKESLASGKKGQDITLNDIICFCVIKALGKFPEMNSHFIGDYIRTFNGVNLGLAVDTPRGLMVPAIAGSDRMSLVQLSQALAAAAAACRKGSADPEVLKSTAASFTVSNLGNYGVEMFTPVINLPQTGILGVCTVTYRPADLGGGTIGIVPFIGLSLTYDHRAVDGGPATLFLKEIKEQLESFEL